MGADLQSGESFSFKFTIIMRLNDEKLLDEAIDSVINQTIGFSENVQLIIVNDKKFDCSAIGLKYEKFSNNIVFINNFFNAHPIFYLKEYICGEYVSLMESMDVFSEDALEMVSNYFGTNDLICIPIFLTNSDFDKVLNNKFDEDRIIKNLDLINIINYPFVCLNSLFFKRELIEILMDKNLNDDIEDFILLNYLLKYSHNVLLLNSGFYSKDISNKKYPIYEIYNFKKDHLLSLLSQINILAITHYESRSIMCSIHYNIVFFISELIKISELDELSINGNQDLFFNYLKNILMSLDKETIYNNEFLRITQKTFLLYLMDNNKTIEYNLNKNDVNLILDNQKIDSLIKHRIWLDIVDIKENCLLLSGIFSSHFSKDSLDFNLVVNNNQKIVKMPLEQIDYPQNERKTIQYLSIPWYYKFNFDVKVPLDFIDREDMYFEIAFKESIELTFNPQIEFRLNTNLSDLGIYCQKGQYIILHDSKSISIINFDYFKMFKLELRNILKIFKSDEKNKHRSIFIRLFYLLIYYYMNKKEIWLINDRKDRADDNALHLFKYALKQKDNIEKFFIIDGNSKDYKKLKKEYANIIKYGSFKHKILYLFSKKRISSFLNESFYNPFYDQKNYDKSAYHNLVTAPRYFLQHGVISCDLTMHINRFDHDLNLIVTSADAERQSFYDLPYNFSSKVVQALGLPRYDNLESKDMKKQIIYIPSWRSYLDKNEKKLTASKYYKSIISLLENKELEEILKKYDYEFIFKPHPELVKYVQYFDDNSFIKIDVDSSFQQLFNESQLLISDFSSVIFDFAYLEKPVIYYQPNDDYHYEKGYFDYETMGFGELINDEKTLIKCIEGYFKKDCKMEEIYKYRVKGFFKYHDKENSKRVYDWIKNN